LQSQQNRLPPERVQLYKLRLAYDAVARLLPVEGKDYRTHIVCSGMDVSIRIEGLTDFGKLFAEHCKLNLARVMNELKDEQEGKRLAASPAGTGAKPQDAASAVSAEEHVL
jgi:hypothetical protein